MKLADIEVGKQYAVGNDRTWGKVARARVAEIRKIIVRCCALGSPRRAMMQRRAVRIEFAGDDPGRIDGLEDTSERGVWISPRNVIREWADHEKIVQARAEATARAKREQAKAKAGSLKLREALKEAGFFGFWTTSNLGTVVAHLPPAEAERLAQILAESA